MRPVTKVRVCLGLNVCLLTLVSTCLFLFASESA